MPPIDPKPVTPAMEQHLRDALTQIPHGKRGQLSATVTNLGAEAMIGWKVKPSVTVSGWAGKAWGTSGWSTGVRGSWVF